MRKTSDLIDSLVDSATPVRRLAPPLLRTCIWLALTAVILALLCIAHGVRPDLSMRLKQPVFVVSMFGALATAVLAAWASFELNLPESRRWWLLLPLPGVAVWVSTIGYGCLTDWVSMNPNGIQMGEAARCFATLLMTSTPLSVAMLIMLRFAAPLRPAMVSAVGGLAIAAMTSFALSLLHNLDATIMILVWNLGMAALIAGMASALGRPLLAWVAARVMPLLRRTYRGRNESHGSSCRPNRQTGKAPCLASFLRTKAASMYCNRSVTVHVLRGLGATTLIVLAFAYGNTSGWLLPALLIGAVLLLGGCPACWLTGLFEAIRTRRNVDAGPLN